MNTSGTLSLKYISIPLLAGFRPNEKFMILLGPEFIFLTSANSIFDGRNHDISSNFRKFDLAADRGVTYKIKNGVGVEILYSYGFEDLLDLMFIDSNGNVLRRERRGSNKVFQMGLFCLLSKNS